MARIQPFRALRYDATRVDLAEVIAPPYDVVARDERGDLYDRNPYNAVRLELTRSLEEEATTDYAEIRRRLEAWREEGVLVRDEDPGFYVLRQTFEVPGVGTLSRDGFFGALGLEDYARRIVRPHERTLAGPKADRLRVLRATRANLSPIFMLYEDREDFLAPILAEALAAPDALVIDAVGGVRHTLARLTDSEAIARVASFLAERPLVIADGHHRYETSLTYRDERRGDVPDPAAPFESTLVYLANAFSRGSLLLPIHRLVRKGPVPTSDGWARDLPGWSCETLPLASADDIREALETHLLPHAAQPSFAADDGSGVLRIFWREEALGERLMVRLLEEEVLARAFGLDADAIRDGAVAFPKSAERAARDVREGEGVVALYLNALSPEDVFRVTAEGAVMPQKSTFFAPKIPTGLVFRADEMA
jgi:uncharacterized protein (DUF1015 family)